MYTPRGWKPFCVSFGFTFYRSVIKVYSILSHFYPCKISDGSVILLMVRHHHNLKIWFQMWLENGSGIGTNNLTVNCIAIVVLWFFQKNFKSYKILVLNIMKQYPLLVMFQKNSLVISFSFFLLAIFFIIKSFLLLATLIFLAIYYLS